MARMGQNVRDILLIEDSASEARLVSRALELADELTRLTVAGDGDEAMAMLSPAKSSPRMILLDLRLPGRSGLDVLRAIRAVPRLRATPVLVLSGSEDPQDVTASYEHGANGFIPKPTDMDGYERMAKALIGHWFGVAMLPSA
jgi:CheY-like chemotaxis protein